MYSEHEGKLVVAERFIRILKHQIYKYTTTVSKNVYFDNIVDKYDNAYHRTITMKPVDVKSASYAECSIDTNAKRAKFKTGDEVRISMYKNSFAKRYTPNLSEEVFALVKSKIPCN